MAQLNFTVGPVEDLDNAPLTFGKHQGSTPEQVLTVEPGYIVWLYEAAQPRCCSKQLYLEACDAVDSIRFLPNEDETCELSDLFDSVP